MVGLTGIVSGETYQGSVIGYGCADFLVTRQRKKSASSNASKVGPDKPTVMLETQYTRVPLQIQGGTFTVPVLINNKLTLNFVIDSGASDVSIPADVVLTLMRTGTLDDTDFLGERIYKLADGSIAPSKTFRIRTLKAGNRVLQNVIGSIAPVAGMPLLGQSFLSRFKAWSIDNERRMLVLQ